MYRFIILAISVSVLAACGGGAGQGSVAAGSRCPSVTAKPDTILLVADTDDYDEALKKDSTDAQFTAGKRVRIYVSTGSEEKMLQAEFITDKADNVTPGNMIPMTAVTKKKDGAIAIAKMPMTPIPGDYHVVLKDGSTVVGCRQFSVK